MIFAAFLVLTTIIASPDNSDHRMLTQKLPWSNMADCEAYIKDKAQIVDDLQETFKVTAQRASCEPRKQPGERPA